MDDFQKNALSWGLAGKNWLDSIPSLVQKYEEKWRFVAHDPYPLNYNYVAPVTLSDGSEAVLKMGFPGDKELVTEREALELYGGKGVVKLLNAAPEDAVLLVEKIEPGMPLSQIADDVQATKIFAEVFKKIRISVPENHSFPSIGDWSAAIPNLRHEYAGKPCPLPEQLLDTAELLFEELIATSEPVKLCHGDLHHDNILSSDREGWLAIDPKVVVAEPAYDVAAMIRNPYQKLKLVDDLQPLLESRLRILAEKLSFDIHRLHKWCLAQTVLSAVWSVEGGAKTPEHALRVADALDDLRL